MLHLLLMLCLLCIALSTLTSPVADQMVRELDTFLCFTQFVLDHYTMFGVSSRSTTSIVILQMERTKRTPLLVPVELPSPFVATPGRSYHHPGLTTV
jgi:hypothetical protein